MAETVGGAMQQLGEAERRLGALTLNLETMLAHFGTLDASLARVFKDLSEGLRGFASHIIDFVSRTNKEMAEAMGALSGAVVELRETYEDLHERAR